MIDTWKLRRYEAFALYERHFFTGTKFSPYLGVGGFMIMLWGGYAPAHRNVNASGFDVLGGVAVPVGASVPLNGRVSFRAGTLFDFGKTSTYGDPTYTASRDVRVEPQIGLVFRLGRVN